MAASALSPLPSLSLFLLYFSLTKKIFYIKRGYETEAEDDRSDGEAKDEAKDEKNETS